MLGSSSYFIDAEVAVAQAEKAPAKAIYRRLNDDGSTKEWVTIDDVTKAATRKELGLDG